MTAAPPQVARGYWWRHKVTGQREQIGNVKRRGQDIYLYIPPKMRGPRILPLALLLAEWEPTGEQGPPP
jgi:hypothetical protein